MNKFNIDQEVYVIHPQDPSEIITAKICGVRRCNDSFEYHVRLESHTLWEVMENAVGENKEDIKSKVDNYIKERLVDSIERLKHSIEDHKLNIDGEGQRLAKKEAELEDIARSCKKS